MRGVVAATLAAGAAAGGWLIGRLSTADSRRALAWQATHDPLTNLHNRHGLRAAAGTAARLGLLVVDLDGFKTVNDDQGHPAGDQVLQEVARRLRSACPPPHATVARLGGDEFAILLVTPEGTDASLHQWLERLGWDLHRSLTAPYEVDAGITARCPRFLTLGASIGAALSPAARPAELDQLVAVADAAMYAAKRAGAGCVRRGAGAVDGGLVGTGTAPTLHPVRHRSTSGGPPAMAGLNSVPDRRRSRWSA